MLLHCCVVTLLHHLIVSLLNFYIVAYIVILIHCCAITLLYYMHQCKITASECKITACVITLLYYMYQCILIHCCVITLLYGSPSPQSSLRWRNVTSLCCYAVFLFSYYTAAAAALDYIRLY